MKKKKGKKTSKKDDTKDEEENPEVTSPTAEEQAGPSEQPSTDVPEEKEEEVAAADNDKAVDDDKTDETSPSSTPSLAQQSKLRSTSFRAGAAGTTSPGPFSPEGETAPDIYRKQVARIEELEKENKKMLKDFADSEKRWKKAEDELAELREGDGEASTKSHNNDEVEKLVRVMSETCALVLNTNSCISP
jgi:hypothetical protein